MSVALIFILFMIVVSTKPSPDHEEKKEYTLEFKKNCEEYLRLILIEDLSKAHQKTYTQEGRTWLFDWRRHLYAITKKLFYDYKPREIEYRLHSDWQERLLKFEEIKKNYYRSLLIYPVTYESQPWRRITFNLPWLQTYVDPHRQWNKITNDPNDDLNDPIATKDQIDDVLKFYRPFTEEERNTAKIARETREAESIADGTFHADIDDYYLPSRARELRPLLKKYPILQEKRIENLIRARHALLKKTLENKRLSELHYEKTLFHVNRIMTEMKLWDAKGVNRDDTDEIFFKKMPTHLRVINSERAYRGYMNADEVFFSGNVFYGYKDRYDDPQHQYLTSDDLGFEITAERIIGLNYKPMLKLAMDMRDFEFSTRNFEVLKITDLLSIDLLLERYEFWSLRNDPYSFLDYQWFSEKFPGNDRGLMMIKPKIVRSISKNQWLIEVQKLLDSAKRLPINPYKFSTRKIGKRFVKQYYDDLIAKKEYVGTLSKTNILTRKMTNFADTLRRLNLLHTLSPKPVLSIPLNLEYQMKMKKLKINDEPPHHDHQENEHEKKTINTVVENFAQQLKNSFNMENNLIGQDASKQSLPNSISESSSSKIIRYGTGGDRPNGGHNSNHPRSKVGNDHVSGHNHAHKLY